MDKKEIKQSPVEEFWQPPYIKYGVNETKPKFSTGLVP